jgi:hypothetical protein
MKISCSIKLPLLAIVVSGSVLAGCSSPDLLIVDSSGKPIAGAKVVGASLSIGGQSTQSDDKGRANIPSAVQPTKWVSVYKEGFRPVENIDIDQKKPIVVKMIKTNG